MAALLDGRDWDYVVGSVHFLGDGALDYDKYDVWTTGESPDRVWRHVLRVARRGGDERASSTSSPTRTSSSTGAHERPWPEQRPALLLRARDGGDRRVAGSRSRSRPPGCASRSARSTRRARSSRWSSTPATRSRCPATRTRPTSSASATTRRSSCSTTVGVTSSAVFERRARRLEPIGVSVAPGIGWDSHRLVAGRPLILGGVDDPARPRPRRATPTPTCSTHAVIDALLGAAGARRHRRSTSPTPTSASRAPTRSALLRDGRRPRGRARPRGRRTSTPRS